jgi:hypothetical protein
MHEPPKWYDADATDNPPWIKALAEVRRPSSKWRHKNDGPFEQCGVATDVWRAT